MFNLSKLAKSFYTFRNIPLNGGVKPHIFGASSYLSLVETSKQHFAGRPKIPKDRSHKEVTKSAALSDEKEAKLSKAEEEAEMKRKKLEAERLRKRMEQPEDPIKTQLVSLEYRITKKKLADIVEKMKKEQLGIIDYEDEIDETEEGAKKVKKARTTPFVRRERKKKEAVEKPLITPNNPLKHPTPRLRKKVITHFRNVEKETNRKFLPDLKNIENPEDSVRTGIICKKVGMTGLFDKWGVRHGLTVLQVDRCQVIQIKTPETDGYCSLQLGAGERNPKRLIKPEIGHYLRAGVPAKRVLKEFHVTPENILPVGFQMSARHFTPGQFVDISGVSNGKGFQGTVVKYGFKMQPATHGNSKSHRALGSTGMRQDPGRVFKNKKMPGRMGGVKRTVPNLQVFKIDATRSLIFVKGSVPGKPGTYCFLRDAVRKKKVNQEFLNYPTFLPQPRVRYACEIVMKPQETDPFEEYYHDNAVVDRE